jgi:hypothetical protein
MGRPAHSPTTYRHSAKPDTPIPLVARKKCHQPPEVRGGWRKAKHTGSMTAKNDDEVVVFYAKSSSVLSAGGGCTRNPCYLYVQRWKVFRGHRSVVVCGGRLCLVSPWVPSVRFEYGSTLSSSDHALLCPCLT